MTMTMTTTGIYELLSTLFNLIELSQPSSVIRTFLSTFTDITPEAKEAGFEYVLCDSGARCLNPFPCCLSTKKGETQRLDKAESAIVRGGNSDDLLVSPLLKPPLRRAHANRAMSRSGLLS